MDLYPHDTVRPAWQSDLHPADAGATPESGVESLNAWFDRVPRMSVTVGHRTIPAFRSTGIMGYQVAFVAALLTAIRTDVPLVVAVGLSATAALSFFGWAILRRAVTGVEYLVLLEHVWVAIGLVAGYLWLADAPMLGGLDVLTVGLAPFLAFGRIGCFTVGCCHGTAARTGIRYGSDHDHLPPWLIGRRLRPVPLLEAAGLFGIFAVSLALVGTRPGAATVWFLAAYGVLRFGTEALRGDDRPHLGPVSVARLMSIVQLGAAVWLWDSVVTDRGGLDIGAMIDPTAEGSLAFIVRLSPIVVVLVAGALLIAARSGRSNPLLERSHLRESWNVISDLAADLTVDLDPAAGGDAAPMMATTSLGVDVGVSLLDSGRVHVSFRHTDHDAGVLAAALGGEVMARNGIHHTSIIVPSHTHPSSAGRSSALPSHAPSSNGRLLISGDSAPTNGHDPHIASGGENRSRTPTAPPHVRHDDDYFSGNPGSLGSPTPPSTGPTGS